jgi:hypothetical protein
MLANARQSAQKRVLVIVKQFAKDSKSVNLRQLQKSTKVAISMPSVSSVLKATEFGMVTGAELAVEKWSRFVMAIGIQLALATAFQLGIRMQLALAIWIQLALAIWIQLAVVIGTPSVFAISLGFAIQVRIGIERVMVFAISLVIENSLQNPILSM